jgi:hypothetical protein
MIEYPHIDYGAGIYGEKVYAFDKLDGSNIRVEWDRRNAKKSVFTGGFVKFGTRTQIISKTNQHFGDSVDAFLDKYCDDLNDIFFHEKFFRNIDKITMFCEYLGHSSFAGFHDLKEPKDVVLFDICINRKGLFLPPKLFVEHFGHLDIPEVIYIGNYNKELIQNIKDNTELKEGVVCKGVRKVKGDDIVWMTKIKTNQWMDRLKHKYGEERLKEEFI